MGQLRAISALNFRIKDGTSSIRVRYSSKTEYTDVEPGVTFDCNTEIVSRAFIAEILTDESASQISKSAADSARSKLLLTS
eukprot:CAMPEP_0179702274 /NCGR_PEP_ID=MMETSP0937-20121108/2191_1 /TAXON_ID=548131 ORGANISM="Ostreococcus mediterraneus, Strain clade-D-RCC2593" /NCGR_SAMPLE_ID=MMETSP0937 /ASSEMBLY_ACC=CAM_ASM_000575 /LENGTH=80 /DNA_ID=CAMNT_0021575399 /DNA_START=268 /DNA_END=510 /DNA_ORIENTATION=-